MKIAVVGVGGVGGYIGAKLCSLIGNHKKKIEVTFIARGEHAEVIKKEGLKIIEDETEFVARPTGVCSAEEAEGIFDLILLCVKSYATKDVLAYLQKNISQDTVILSLANGVNNAEVIKNLVDAKVIKGCVYILSHRESAGVIRKKGKVFAISLGDEKFIGEALYVEHLFKDAGLRAKFMEDIEHALWKKYLFISAFASLTSYYDMSIKKVYEQHFDKAKALVNEIASVAKAKGVNIDEEVEKTLQTASSLPEDASTSMHLDFQENRQTELDALSKYIVDEGKLLGVATPTMQEVYEVLQKR